MAMAPTETTDTVCQTLKTCNYATEEIVDPEINDSIFPISVFSADRECNARQTCAEFFEIAKIDAYATVCTLLPTDNIKILFADTCNSLDSNYNTANWETFLVREANAALVSQSGYFHSPEWAASVETPSSMRIKGPVRTSVDKSNVGKCNLLIELGFQNQVGRQRLRRQSSFDIRKTQ